MAIAKSAFDSAWVIESAGLRAAKSVTSYTIQVLQEIGIEEGTCAPRSINNVDLPSFDVIVVLCEEMPPLPLQARYYHWRIEDPWGSGTEEEQLFRYRAVRNELVQRIHQLRNELQQ